MHWSLVYLALVPAALFLLFAALFTRAALLRLRAGERTRAWPSTSGRITRSSVRREESADGDGGTYDVFHAHIEYAYEVDGEPRTGSAIHVNQEAYSSRRRAQRLARRYAEGADVRVFYDPADPGRAALQAGTGFSPYTYLAMAALMVVAAFYAARLMCGANAAVAAGAPAVCRLVQ